MFFRVCLRLAMRPQCVCAPPTTSSVEGLGLSLTSWIDFFKIWLASFPSKMVLSPDQGVWTLHVLPNTSFPDSYLIFLLLPRVARSRMRFMRIWYRFPAVWSVSLLGTSYLICIKNFCQLLWYCFRMCPYKITYLVNC
jgi:hypothetical protein